MNDNDFDRPEAISAPPETPHFDDAGAVWSAQPVVPLKEINTTVKNRRRWFIAAAFVIAMALGAASALVASYLKLRTARVIASGVSEEPVAVAEPVPSESPLTEDVEPVVAQEEIQGAEVFVAPAKEPKRRTVRRTNTDVTRVPRDLNEEEDLDRIRDAVLYDEWQERRARRVLRRERRRAERYNHRDLSNLDEIFEGRRRRRP